MMRKRRDGICFHLANAVHRSPRQALRGLSARRQGRRPPGSRLIRMCQQRLRLRTGE